MAADADSAGVTFRRHRPQARRARILVALAWLCLCVASFLPSSAGAWEVSAWTFGDGASLSTAAGAGAIDEVQADWYWITAAGEVVGEDVDPVFVLLAHQTGCRVLATVSNYVDGFSPELAHAVLVSPAARTRLVDELRAVCAAVGYDGVDLDLESVPADDRDLLSAFVEELAAGLHADRRILAMAVHPKTSEPGDWFGAIAEDYARLGAAVDEFQVMTYAYSGPWSDPGPIAPPDWVDEVLDFTVTQVDPAKVWMGLPFYGCDWWPGGGEEIVWEQALQRQRAHRAPVILTASREGRFLYQDGRGRHVVYCQSRASLTIKLRVLTRRHPGLAGVAVWVMGGEDPRYWPLLARELRR